MLSKTWSRKALQLQRSGLPGLGFRVEGLGFRVEGLGFRLEGLGLRV